MKTKQIVKIEEVNDVEYVYDPCCDSPNTYISNGIVSHNCVLWIDEIEKGLSGASSSGRTDGGTTSRVLSTFLTWMQEKIAPVFVVATANDHASIPPEFLRAGRFDEIFFVDLPSQYERQEIFTALLNKKGLDANKFDVENLASYGISKYKKNEYGLSGAELEKAIEIAQLNGFIDGARKIVNEDIIDALKGIKPLSQIRSEDFEALTEWADHSQCLKANTVKAEKVSLGTGGENRVLDLDLD